MLLSVAIGSLLAFPHSPAAFGIVDEGHMMADEYLTTDQAAERYRLSVSWLAKLRVFGGGPAYLKVGRRCLYKASTFEAWLDDHAQRNTSEGSS